MHNINRSSGSLNGAKASCYITPLANNYVTIIVKTTMTTLNIYVCKTNENICRSNYNVLKIGMVPTNDYVLSNA